MGVKVKNLRYTFPKTNRPVIHDISFEVPDGSVTSVIGANGVGKSTLFKSILGIYKSEGDVWINGTRRQDLSHEDLHRQVGYMTLESAWNSLLNDRIMLYPAGRGGLWMWLKRWCAIPGC
jgi:ABC-type bacteriocin/lantibiotic exporter with double-glycine peptidase domain